MTTKQISVCSLLLIAGFINGSEAPKSDSISSFEKATKRTAKKNYENEKYISSLKKWRNEEYPKECFKAGYPEEKFTSFPIEHDVYNQSDNKGKRCVAYQFHLETQKFIAKELFIAEEQRLANHREMIRLDAYGARHS